MDSANTSERKERKRAEGQGAAQEWIRPKDVVARFGIGRTRLYALIAEGQVKSVCVRTAAEKRGTRLVCLASLRAYLDTLWHEHGRDGSEKPQVEEGGVA